MKTIQQTALVFAGLVSLGLTTVSADTFLREWTESFPASPGKSLRIDAGSAHLEVRPGAIPGPVRFRSHRDPEN